METLDVSLWAEFPLKQSEYAKDKVGSSIKFGMEADKINEKDFNKRADLFMDKLFDDLSQRLVERGSGLIDKMVDDRIEEIRQEYEEKLDLARKEIIKLKKSK